MKRRDYSTPLKTRINNPQHRLDAYPKSGPKTASDFRVGSKTQTKSLMDNVSIDVEKLPENLYNELIRDNIRLKEEVEYLKSLISDIRNEY